jgi:hypothetical protein
MTKSGKLKSHFSAIRQAHKHLNEPTERGTRARALFKRISGDKKTYSEANFNKAQRAGTGTGISLSKVRSDIGKHKKQRKADLKAEWKQLKKEGAPVGSFKEFFKAQKDDDIDFTAVQELFNSP